MKDSLWSIDLFRCESATLRPGTGLGRRNTPAAHWVRRPNGRNCQWRRTLPHVQPRHSMAPVCPTTSAPTNVYRGQWQPICGFPVLNQNRPLCSRANVLCGTAIGTIRRRVFGSHVVLDDVGPERSCSIALRTHFNAYRSHTGLEGRTPDPVTPRYARPVPGSIPMDGNATGQASITPQWLPDSPKTGAPCG